MSTQISPLACIEKGAQLGENVTIAPFVHVAATAVVGDGCILDSHAVVKDYTTLGPRCHLHSHCVIGDLPQDLSFTGEPSYVAVGSDCTFRECVTVHRGAAPGSTTTIGSHVYMMACSHAAHNTVVGDHVIMANCSLLAGHVHVGDHVFVGGSTPVHQFCHIGRYAMIGGASGVGKDVPPFCITASQRPSEVAGLNVVGLRRGGFTPDQRKQIKECFDWIYRAGLNLTQAREKLLALPGNPYAPEFAAFLAEAKRGICTLPAGTASAPL